MAEITGWFSLPNGTHVPIMNGESKANATKRFLNSKYGKDINKLKNTTSKGKNVDKKYIDYSDNLDDFRYDNPDIDAERVLKTETQKQAVEDYVFESADYNYNMVEFPDQYKDKLDVLDSCIQNKLSNDIYTYRVMDFEIEGIEFGKSFDRKGYMSTTISKDVADEMLNDVGGVQIKLKVSAGTKALYIGNLKSSKNSKYDFDYQQEELLLGRNSHVKITKKIDDEHFEGEIYYD